MHEKIDITVRMAHEGDIADIYELITELAEYERAADEVINTPEQLLKDWQNGFYKAWVAQFNGQTVGMALCYDRYSTWKGRCLYLEDIVVKHSYRRSGAGSALMRALIEYAKQHQYFSINWQVLTWNEPALNFYKKWKAEIDKEWWNGRIILK